jgi:hypothetical protein
MIFKEGPNNIFLARTSDRAWKAEPTKDCCAFAPGRRALNWQLLWFAALCPPPRHPF